MSEIKKILEDLISEDGLLYAVLSRPRRKDGEHEKITVRPVIIRERRQYQFEYFGERQTTQRNLDTMQATEELDSLLKNAFRQALINTPEADYQILVSKKGKSTVLKKPPTRRTVDKDPNRAKKHILADGEPCPFLFKLGVMNESGKVLASNYNKFRQINKFLEIVSDCLPAIEKDKEIRVVDFGCGKGYLTFALHDFLSRKTEANLDVIGVDRNESLVSFCNDIASELACKGLRFVQGDIESAPVNRADMVVALHACDTATDVALAKAVRWRSEIILAAPCCQHELAGQIQNDLLKPLLKHGIIKERLAALLTDALRANLLEQQGYTVQIMEFIDLEGTPKNLMIRALRTGKSDEQAASDYDLLKETFSVEPSLERLLKEQPDPRSGRSID